MAACLLQVYSHIGREEVRANLVVVVPTCENGLETDRSPSSKRAVPPCVPCAAAAWQNDRAPQKAPRSRGRAARANTKRGLDRVRSWRRKVVAK